MRLTNRDSIMGRKHDLAHGLASIWKSKLKNDRYELIENAIDKLGQLEDIEEELGIDLITLIKVWNAVLQKKYLWTKYDNELDETDDVVIGDEMNGLFFIYFYWDNGKHLVFPLTDYGKTWALTREELL